MSNTKTSAQWFERRFEPDQRKLQRECAVCGRAMWFPPSKADKYVTCGGDCAAKRYAAMRKPEKLVAPRAPPRVWQCKQCCAEHTGGKAVRVFCSQACRAAWLAARTAALVEERSRSCACCGNSFVPKLSQIKGGQGIYCSQACARASGVGAHLVTPENLRKAHEARQLALAKSQGAWYKSGAEHPSWKGGRAASMERRRDKDRENLRRYRAANRDKVREFVNRRGGRKIGRLPKGTVGRIGALQQWKCAICRVSVKDAYHVDHIMPLAKGGKHEAANIQILCPSCNVRKSAKHPVDFMQERGFLL